MAVEVPRAAAGDIDDLSSSRSRPVNILLVDDHEENLFALETALGDLGHNLVKARSGREALKCLLDRDFALILMDVLMPEMDGFETAALIRRRERSEHTPIIFLTAISNGEIQVYKGYSVGAVDYLIKPVDAGVLRAKVSVFVDLYNKREQVKEQAERLRRMESKQYRHEIARIRDQRNRFFSLSLDIMCILGCDGLFKEANPAWQTTMGYAEGELYGRPLLELVHEEDRETTRAMLAAPAERGNISFENRCRRKDGGYRWLLWSATVHRQDKVYYAVARDITDHKKAEEALKAMNESLETLVQRRTHALTEANRELQREVAERKVAETAIRLYADIVENAQIGMAVLQAVGGDPNELRIITINPAGQALLGISAVPLVGKTLFEAFPKIRRSDYPKLLMDVLQSGKPKDLGEIVSGRKTFGVFSVQLFPLPNRCVGIAFENITERKLKAEALIRLEQLKAEIEQHRRMDMLKDEFISTVSHELRTPLTIVQCSIDNLRDGLVGRLTKPQREVIHLTHNNIQRLAKMINNLLDLSRLESGKMKINEKLFEIRPLIDDIVKGFHVAVPNRDIAVEQDRPLQTPVVKGDPDMIAQVVTNLMDNAVRYAKSRVTLRLQQHSKGIQISVIDDGEGIPVDKIGDLFNKFVQVNRVRGAGYKGTGLGLAICKEIISLHGGNIWAESKVGGGTRMHFTLTEQLGPPPQKTPGRRR